MLEKLIGDLGSKGNMETILEWKFAMSHPYLHTIIEISDSFLYVVLFVGGYMVVKKLFTSGKGLR